MSYYVKVEGCINLKDNLSDEVKGKIINLVNEFLEYPSYMSCCDTMASNQLVISQDLKYYKKQFQEFYEEITPYCKTATIEFTGDDGDLWIHSFNEEKQEWLEGRGQIVYFDYGHFAGAEQNKQKDDDDMEL